MSSARHTGLIWNRHDSLTSRMPRDRLAAHVVCPPAQTVWRAGHDRGSVTQRDAGDVLQLRRFALAIEAIPVHVVEFVSATPMRNATKRRC